MMYIECIFFIKAQGGQAMIRTNIYLTEPQMKKFKTISKKTGLAVSDLIRRALDEWLERYEGKGERR